MLAEHQCRQNEDGLFRRWFSDEYFDLILWESRPLEYFGFQLCYDKEKRERALCWSQRAHYSHMQIDGGESDPGKNRSPVMIGGSPFPLEKVKKEFEKRSGTLPSEVRDFILNHLNLYKANNKPNQSR